MSEKHNIVDLRDAESIQLFMNVIKSYYPDGINNIDSVKKYPNDVLMYLSEIEKILEFDIPCDIEKSIIDKKTREIIISIISGVKNNKDVILDNIHKILITNKILNIESNILIDFLFNQKVSFDAIKKMTPFEFISIILKIINFDRLFLNIALYDAIGNAIKNENIKILDNQIELKWEIRDRKYIFHQNSIIEMYEGKKMLKMNFDEKIMPIINPNLIINELGIRTINIDYIFNEILSVHGEIIGYKYEKNNEKIDLSKIKNISVIESFLLISICKKILNSLLKMYEKVFGKYNIDDYTLQFMDCIKEKIEKFDNYISKYFFP